MKIKIKKINNYWCLEEENCSYIFLKPIHNKLKIMTLTIIKELPKEIKDQILEKLIIEKIKDIYTYEKIINIYEDEENNLYYKEKYEYN